MNTHMSIRFRKALATAFAAAVFAASAADTYYWRGDHKSWQDWTNIADGGWSLSRNLHSAPAHVPGSDASDLLWSFNEPGSGTSDYEYYIGKFDLGGGTYTLAGYSTGSGAGQTWKAYQWHLTNGTMTVRSAQKANAGTTFQYYVWNGATFNYNMPGIETSTQRSSYNNIYNIGNGSLDDRWYVKSGGIFNVASPVTFLRCKISVDAGGTLSFQNGTFDINNNIASGYPITVTSSGTLLLPNGLDWVDGDPWGGAHDCKVFTVTQNAGETRLGGNFRKTAVEQHSYRVAMKYVLNGGTLTSAENASVSFVRRNTRASGYTASEEVFAEMPASAAATVQTLSGSTLDMSLFTYGTGATLTKTGAGTLVLTDLPDAVNVSAGRLRLAKAVSSLAGVTLESGATLEFAQTGNAAAAAPAGFAGAAFALDNSEGVFAVGSTVVTSDDADFLAAVAASLNAGSTLPEGSFASVSAGAVRLITPPSAYTFSCKGELDLGDSSGWNAPGYEGQDVFVSGPETIALISPSTPEFNSITLTDGATLKVAGTDIALPPISQMTPSALLVPGGSSAMLTEFVSAGDASALPILEVETNGVLTVARGMKFRNVAIRLYGEIGVPPLKADIGANQGISFGYAAAGETTYFAMESVGGNINVSGNTGTSQYALDFAYAEPASGGAGAGRVIAAGDLLLKDTTFNVPSTANRYIGKRFGGENPEDSGIRLVLDNTVLPIERLNTFRSGTVICRNGGKLQRVSTHPGNWTSFELTRYAKLAFEGDGSGLVLPYSQVNTPFSFDYWGAGSYWDVSHDQLVFRDGASMAAHMYWGFKHSNMSFSNGVYQVATLPYTDGNPNPPGGDPRNWMTNAFNEAYNVRIEKGGKLFFQSASVLGGSEWDRFVTLANRPIVGDGDFVMTNGVPGRGFSAMVTAGNNSATGSISVAPSADRTVLYFANGANWAGTVVGNEHVALTNALDAAAPATVAFGALELTGKMPIRVWPTGASDRINLGGAISGTGCLAPVNAGNARVAAGTVFTLGTYPASLPLPDNSLLKKGWEFSSVAAGEQGKVLLQLTYVPSGLSVIIR